MSSWGSFLHVKNVIYKLKCFSVFICLKQHQIDNESLMAVFSLVLKRGIALLTAALESGGLFTKKCVLPT